MASIAKPKMMTAQPSVGERLGNFFSQEVVLFLCLIVLCIVVQGVNERFLAQRNVLDVLTNSSIIAVAAVGMSMVIISGNIDISVGSLIGVLATISGTLAVNAEAGGYPLWISWVVPLIVGPFVGALIGFLVAYLRIPSIVVSLGMMSILQGGLIIATGGAWIYNLPEGYGIAQEKIFDIPVPIYFMVILTIIAALWLRYSTTGRAIYAVGGNAEAARLSGISEQRIIMTVFTINGFMVGIASLLFATKFNAIQSTVPPGIELVIITASVVGGVSILGGIGTVVGSTLAAIFVQAIGSAMQFTRISDYWIQAVQGVLILITVLVDLFRRRQMMRRS
jgi:ribose/xylose/arabinose/galactoside ABC-type transport system permease subunit